MRAGVANSRSRFPRPATAEAVRVNMALSRTRMRNSSSAQPITPPMT